MVLWLNFLPGKHEDLGLDSLNIKWVREYTPVISILPREVDTKIPRSSGQLDWLVQWRTGRRPCLKTKPNAQAVL